jgi:Pyridoxamine 5'-phosphate oxidase
VGKVYDTITPQLAAWIARQPMFFVGTAPGGDDGHVNISPKGPIGTLRILDEHTVAYLDLIGSGAETIAHVQENGRIVVMLCAFDGPPRILRLHGHAVVLEHGAIAFPDVEVLPEQLRTVVRVDVERIADSCGYGVPLMDYVGERSNSRRWAEGKLDKEGPDALEQYKAEKNTVSIDGLPALTSSGSRA